MKKFLLASAALATMTGSAFAADIVTPAPVYTPPPVSTPVAQQFNWSGFKVGATGGWNWNQQKFSAKDINSSSHESNSGTIGAFAGYDYQFSNNVVLGVEGDVTYNPDNNAKFTYAQGQSGKMGYDWEGSIRGRLGYAFDNTLLYTTGGWAIADGYNLANGTKKEDTYNGWTIGAGVDYAFTNNIFARVEYRYTDYGNGSSSDHGSLADVQGKDLTSNRVMAGIGVKF
ncbi:porin family protein [Martelella alba]|uniref:Porin family protein n=1 Tax=Martelella alba TaxID=2590451 RepID=A0A506UDB7_9HYPH|nr:outer membrane protein [Martelella alba]TPW30795.1 porin family protein [Martelella alba]